MEAKIIEKFTSTLVTAICDSVQSVTEECLAKGLISPETFSNIMKSTAISNDKTRNLIESVKNCTIIDGTSFDLFLRILNEKLPKRGSAKLLMDMRAELASRLAQTSSHEDEYATLVPSSYTSHGIMTYTYHGQPSVPHAHDVSRILSQEQNPFIGRLEESIRQQERAVAEMKLLKEKLKESGERLNGEPANRQSPNAHEKDLGSTTCTSSMSEADHDMMQIKEKIKNLEEKSKELDTVAGLEVQKWGGGGAHSY